MPSDTDTDTDTDDAASPDTDAAEGDTEGEEEAFSVEDVTRAEQSPDDALFEDERAQTLSTVINIREDLAVRSRKLQQELDEFMDALESMEAALESADPDTMSEPIREKHEETLQRVKQNKQTFGRFVNR